MIVRCANCQTEFSLDDRQVGPEGAPVRCSVCQYVFRVDPPATREATWQIRTVEDLTFTAPNLPTLRQWIREGRLHPEDQVSRTGKHWLRLGDMPEFSEVFRGFGGLPEVFVEVEVPAHSAMDELGPPPSFGTDSHGAPVQAIVPAPSEAIDLASEGSQRTDDLADFGGVPIAVHDDGPEAPAELDDHEDTTVSASMSRPATESHSSRLRIDDMDEPRRHAPRKSAGDTAVVRRLDIEDVDDVEDVDDAADSAAPRRPGVPLPVPRRTPSRPAAVADTDPASMLDAVTALVKPITRAAVESDARTRTAVDAAPPAAGTAGELSRVSPSELSASSSASMSARRSPAPREPRRSRSWPLFAGLGALAGVAVVFGIPDIRDRVLGFAGLAVTSDDGPEVDPVADAALRTRVALAALEPKTVDELRRGLAAQIEASTDPAVKARLQLLDTEVLAAVVFEGRVKAALAVQAAKAAGEPDPAVAPAEGASVDELDERIRQLPALSGAADDGVAAARAEVAAAVARGTIPKSLGALGVDAIGRELQLLAMAAPWLNQPNAKLPAGLLGGLAELVSPSATASLLLALTYWRAGDEARATAEVETLLVRAPAQPTAIAFAAALARTDRTKAGVDGGARPKDDGAAADGALPAGDGPAVVDPPPTSDTSGDTGRETEPVISDAGEPPSAPRLSVDGLIQRGCDKVDAGDASGALDYLKQAVERRPKDIDALTCLGQAHTKLGKTSRALSYYERALDINAGFRPALEAGARAAAKLGRTSQAVRYYKRLLEIDSGNETARAYVDEHDSPSPDTSE